MSDIMQPGTVGSPLLELSHAKCELWFLISVWKIDYLLFFQH